MTDSSPAAVKRRLRATVRDMEPPTQAEAEGVRTALAAWLSARDPCSVLGYLPLPGEIALEALVDGLPEHRWLLTRTPAEGWLTVHRHDTPLEVHPFGFSQPVEGSDEVEPAEVDIALVPGLAFDRRGFRLGRGLGYYDELLARLARTAEMVGVTVERMILEAIPGEAHDVRVGWLATESGVRRVA